MEEEDDYNDAKNIDFDQKERKNKNEKNKIEIEHENDDDESVERGARVKDGLDKLSKLKKKKLINKNPSDNEKKNKPVGQFDSLF